MQKKPKDDKSESKTAKKRAGRSINKKGVGCPKNSYPDSNEHSEKPNKGCALQKGEDKRGNWYKKKVEQEEVKDHLQAYSCIGDCQWSRKCLPAYSPTWDWEKQERKGRKANCSLHIEPIP